MIKISTLLMVVTFTLFAQIFNVSSTPELRIALETAATNGEHDTITLSDGTYKTTNDGGGTFIYFSNEDNNLTLIGSSSKNVILSGDNQHQIFNHQSTLNAPLKLEKLSFVDGNNTSSNGGGVYTDYSIDVIDCYFANNSASIGGGFYSTPTVNDTSILLPIPSSPLSTPPLVVPDLTSSLTVESSVVNSIFRSNSASTEGGAFYASDIKAVNILVVNNSSGIYLGGSENNIILNTIFMDNNSSDIKGSPGVIISNLDNNYLDISKVSVSNFKSNNIFDGVTLGFVDEANGDYNLTAVSDLIDAGTTTITGLTLPTTDLNGNVRIVGGNIDIGPYEFSTTKPTLSNFTYSGIAKELGELTFSVDYTLSDGRAIDKIEFDYTNNGTWTTDNTYTFDTAGTYTINAKVTDSENESSTVSLSLTIAPLPFSDMTDEQKLVKAIDPTYYDDIITIINIEKSASNASGVTTGENNVVLDPNSYGLRTQAELDTAVSDTNISAYEAGKQYVLNNLSEFDLFTLAEKLVAESNAEATGKQYVKDNLAEFSLVTVADKDTAVSAATSTGEATGKKYVQTNLAEFNLVTLADKNIAIAEVNATATAAGIIIGKDMVIENPSSYGLITSAELNASSSVTLATGIESGKQYVQDNLAEFELTTITDKAIAVNDANTTGYNLGASEKETSILKTPLEYGLVSQADLNASVADAIANGLTQGKEYVQQNLSEFDLVSKPTIEVSPTTLASLDTGWTLASTPFEITDMSVFDTVNLVWIFNNTTNSWSAYSSDADTMGVINSSDSINAITTIPAGSGVWVLK